ncbi:hypothetical protein SAMN05216289_102193 [Dokdonella immobilis]|uniref:Uncharacterized protein n=2 Tax=Dokdonella immobilis TaxID=578942 RepID=A0A1I4VKX0_9GAMM|nr:hypothetical protein SAMN05216289_102193 [Dokdonella immobilis]
MALVAPAGALSLDIETTPSGDLFPALELSQPRTADGGEAHAGNGLLRLRVGHSGQPRDARLTVSTPGLTTATVIDTHIDEDIVLRPRLKWDIGALRGMQGVRRQALQVVLSSPGMDPIIRTVEIRLHPLDEALYFVREGNNRIDLGWSFAAWVDPQDPVIDELLQLAGIDITGMMRMPSNRADRLARARAIWFGLERHGLRYADDSAGISQGPVVYSQRVRLLSSTWDERVANCLDGSVLIASALERLGVGSFLVLVPGHAFVGFYTDDARHEAEFLETTLLGFAGQARPAPSGSGARPARQRAIEGFEAARRAGRDRYRRIAPRLDGRHRPDYALIDISKARAYGIMPLAVGRGDRAGSAPVALSAPHRPQRPTSHIP